jgi:hypothetical protein
MLSLLLPIPLLALSVEALTASFKLGSRPSALVADCTDSTCGQLGNIQDSVYISTITVGGVCEYPEVFLVIQLILIKLYYSVHCPA